MTFTSSILMCLVTITLGQPLKFTRPSWRGNKDVEWNLLDHYCDGHPPSSTLEVVTLERPSVFYLINGRLHSRMNLDSESAYLTNHLGSLFRTSETVEEAAFSLADFFLLLSGDEEKSRDRCAKHVAHLIRDENFRPIQLEKIMKSFDKNPSNECLNKTVLITRIKLEMDKGEYVENVKNKELSSRYPAGSLSKSSSSLSSRSSSSSSSSTSSSLALFPTQPPVLFVPPSSLVSPSSRGEGTSIAERAKQQDNRQQSLLNKEKENVPKAMIRHFNEWKSNYEIQLARNRGPATETLIRLARRWLGEPYYIKFVARFLQFKDDAMIVPTFSDLMKGLYVRNSTAYLNRNDFKENLIREGLVFILKKKLYKAPLAWK